jgi:alanyl-tRNA synthetase
MGSLNVGQRFIRYYRDNGFKILDRGSLLAPSVPMTFVGSAGLIQIESAIEQGEDRAGECYVLLQTCFRHFDLAKVGQSPVHLSLFEMGGAFSFGQERRENDLGKIWNFLTSELGFHQRQIWATYFSGGKLDGHEFEKDVETAQAWRNIGLHPSRIVGLGTKTNFWKQGGGIYGKERFRKCGPTTELFVDRGLPCDRGAACQPDCGCERFIEIANVLFIHSLIDQMTQLLSPLITPFTETVIGVERVTMSLQQKPSVFDIECLAPLVRLIRSCHQTMESSGSNKPARSEQVVADHIRALLFLTADGAPPPGKGGRARIMRMLIREVIACQKILGISDVSFVPNLVNAAFDLYQGQYAGLGEGRERLLTYFASEGRRFEQTLSVGRRRLDRIIQRGGNGSISGEQALNLVKGHGFPFSLLEVTLAQRGIELDKQEYWNAHRQWRRKVVGAGQSGGADKVL